MNISMEIRSRFATKVFSCKADTLRKEQYARKKRLIESLKKQRDELVNGDKTQIHPAYIKRVEIEKKAESVLYFLLTPKNQKARNFETVLKETFGL